MSARAKRSVWSRVVERFVRRRSEPPSDEDAARVLRKVLGPCAICGRTLERHGQWRLAAAHVGPPSEAAVALTALVSQRRWREASEIAEWRWNRDAREYHAVRCPDSGGIYLVTAIFPAWGPTWVESSRVLSDADREQVSALADGRWWTL